MEVNVLLSESAAQRSILSAKSYVQAEGILSAETPEMLADVASAVGLTVDDAGVFQTGRKEGLYYLVGSKAFALGTVETIGSLARKRLDGKFVVWEATDDGLPGKAPVNVLTFNKWSDALRNFLGRGTGAVVRAAETGNAESDTSGAWTSVFDSLNAAKSVKEKRDIVAKACGITAGKMSKLHFEKDDDSGEALVQAAVVDALRPKEFGPAMYGLERLTKFTIDDFETDLPLGTEVLIRLSEHALIVANGADAFDKFGQVVNSGKDLFSDVAATEEKKALSPDEMYAALVDLLKTNGYSVTKNGGLSNKSKDAFTSSYIHNILADLWFTAKDVTLNTGYAAVQVYSGSDVVGYIDLVSKSVHLGKASVKSTGPISLDDLDGSARTSNAPQYPDATSQAPAMKKIKVNAEIAVTETDFDWLQDEIVKENTVAGKYADKTPLVKSREIATFIYGKTATVKQVLKTHVFDIKHIESGTCLTATPIATVKAKKTGYSLVLVSREDSPKTFLPAMSGAKFAIVSAQLTPAGAVKGKPEHVTKVRNMREGMQYMMIGVQPEA